MSALFHCGRHRLSIDRPLIMGILNVTDDSFSGDGCRGDLDRAVDRAMTMVEAGVDIIDIGAESTRPGASYLTVEAEIDRLLPLLERLRSIDLPISIDTNKTEVMAAVIEAGASIINDIRALLAPGAIELVARSDVGVCLMHMQNDPPTMQQEPVYDDVVAEVEGFLLGRAKTCEAAGISTERIMLDPGFGFGKTLEHNVTLFQSIDRLSGLGYPLLVGVSRKNFLGKLTNRPVDARAGVSAAAAMLAAQAGARIVRVHDVEETRDLLILLDRLDRHSN